MPILVFVLTCDCSTIPPSGYESILALMQLPQNSLYSPRPEPPPRDRQRRRKTPSAFRNDKKTRVLSRQCSMRSRTPYHFDESPRPFLSKWLKDQTSRAQRRASVARTHSVAGETAPWKEVVRTQARKVGAVGSVTV